MLTKEQSQKFIDFYFERYRMPWEFLKDTNNRLLDIWIWAEFEEEEIQAWKEFINGMLWKQASKLYKMRPYWKQTIWEKVFGDLWLNYWPKIIWKKE